MHEIESDARTHRNDSTISLWGEVDEAAHRELCLELSADDWGPLSEREYECVQDRWLRRSQRRRRPPRMAPAARRTRARHGHPQSRSRKTTGTDDEDPDPPPRAPSNTNPLSVEEADFVRFLVAQAVKRSMARSRARDGVNTEPTPSTLKIREVN